VEGIFLSSSIFNGPVVAQDQLLATAQILRQRYRYQGYLHLKIMPGAQPAQVEEAMLLADRLSLNLEGPHSEALSRLAPQKDFQSDLIHPLHLIHKIRSEKDPDRAWNRKWPSSTTQFVVGAAGETDQDLLERTANLTRTAGISRAYFSSFTPIKNTPLDYLPASHPKREFRLYQAFYLMRDYGFGAQDLPFNQAGNLFLNQDPKMAWAEKNFKHQPLEINSANTDLLLRVPGIGPARAKAILLLRSHGHIKSFDQLIKRKLVAPRSLPYILVDGKSSPLQPRLF
jgi:predicted DNA-binding helix-hairpin-helix protein